MLSTVQLLVQATKNDPEKHSCANCQNCGDTVDGEGDSVARSHSALVHVGGVDRGGVRKTIDKRKGSSTLGLGSDKSV